MYKYSIGFRMNFDTVRPEDMRSFVTRYLENFDRYEFKVTNQLLSSGKIVKLLCMSEKLANGKYSLHLPKDSLFNVGSYNQTCRMIEYLKFHIPRNKVFLVTHIPYKNFSFYIEKLLNLLKILPENYVLLLENIQIFDGNFNYLEQINDLFSYLNKNNIKNVGFCIDFGHLLFGCSYEGISQKQALLKLHSMQFLMPCIKEIHIHDYNKVDHLQLHTGLLNLKLLSTFIKKSNLCVPIILEVSIINPNDDGIKQISIIYNNFNA